jgi:hypothetical protein
MITALNPPWSKRMIKKYSSQISDRAREFSLPTPLWDEQYSVSDDHDVLLGCAHYGCVYRTNQPGIVFKITTDVSEAHFIKIALDLKKQIDPIGIVEYFKVFALPPETTHLNRPVFAVWREEAFNVGHPSEGWRELMDQKESALSNEMFRSEFSYYSRSWQQFNNRLAQYMHHASEVRNRLVLLHKKLTPDEYWNYAELQWNRSSSLYDELYAADGELKTVAEVAGRVACELGHCPGRSWEMRLPIHLAICNQHAEMMRNEFLGDGVGGVLQDYLEAGMLMADVHMGNIGTRRDDVTPIIVDPGHAVLFKREFETIGVTLL